MQSFGTFISDNKGLATALAVLAAILVIAILLFLYRLLFGRRLHMTGGRSRQPRLGVVDAFDLDRQRQLVLVRRDNVEHLLMIGGPNDLVIESAFQRAQPSVALPVGRDKEGIVPAAPVVPMTLPLGLPESGLGPIDTRPFGAPTGDAERPASASAPPPLDLVERVKPGDLGPLADMPAPGPVATPGPAPAEPPAPTPAVAEPVAPEQAPIPAPARPFPSRINQPMPQRPAGTALPPRPPLTSLRTPPVPPANGAAPAPAPARPASLLPNRPMPLTPLQRGTSAASLRRDPPPAPPSAPEDNGPAAPAPAPQPATPPRSDAPPPVPTSLAPATDGRPTIPITLDSIESLEEEMAKLLGRAAAVEKK